MWMSGFGSNERGVRTKAYFLMQHALLHSLDATLRTGYFNEGGTGC